MSNLPEKTPIEDYDKRTKNKILDKKNCFIWRT